jgi:hypothetical protein
MYKFVCDHVCDIIFDTTALQVDKTPIQMTNYNQFNTAIMVK